MITIPITLYLDGEEHETEMDVEYNIHHNKAEILACYCEEFPIPQSNLSQQMHLTAEKYFIENLHQIIADTEQAHAESQWECEMDR